MRDFGALDGSWGAAKFGGSLPDIVCDNATVVYPTEHVKISGLLDSGTNHHHLPSARKLRVLVN